MVGSLNAGKTPTVEAYAERDLHLFRLSDEDIRAEYEAYTRMYLDDATAAPVRGGTALDPRTARPLPPSLPTQRPTPRVRRTCHLTAGGGEALHTSRLRQARYGRHSSGPCPAPSPAPSSEQMRGMAEMTLIKLGEAVDKPQA